MLPIIKNRLLPSLVTLHDLTLKYIFEKDAVTQTELRVIEEGVSGWSKVIGLNQSEKWELTRIVNALIANEKGFFDRSKELQREHKVDYHKMYNAGLPFIVIEGRKHWNKS